MPIRVRGRADNLELAAAGSWASRAGARASPDHQPRRGHRQTCAGGGGPVDNPCWRGLWPRLLAAAPASTASLDVSTDDLGPVAEGPWTSPTGRGLRPQMPSLDAGTDNLGLAAEGLWISTRWAWPPAPTAKPRRRHRQSWLVAKGLWTSRAGGRPPAPIASLGLGTDSSGALRERCG
jgi:hypothetical protein